jgi:hypothetical protein
LGAAGAPTPSILSIGTNEYNSHSITVWTLVILSMNNFSACYLPAEDEKDRKSWKDKRGYKKLSEKTAKGQNTEKTRKALGKGVVNLLMFSIVHWARAAQ